MRAPIPANEQQRLAALRDYQILDSSAEETYDDITALVTYVCGVPMANISLVDEARQWFKSRIGIEARETPREIAFCAHTILRNEPMIIGDALLDERFVDNVMVTGEPHIRFYAGFPLVTPEGFAVGSLCAIDRKPRELSPEQRQAMQALARQVIALMELRKVSARLADELRKVKTLQGLLPICAWCKRIRDDQGYWDGVEHYISTRTDADFTHGICPDCSAKVREKAKGGG
jgi:GAF domain-containing protein